MNKLLTVNDLSEMLSVKPKTIYQWAELGQIPSIKLGRCLRFDIEDIRAWIPLYKKTAREGYNTSTQARGPRKGGE